MNKRQTVKFAKLQNKRERPSKWEYDSKRRSATLTQSSFVK